MGEWANGARIPGTLAAQARVELNRSRMQRRKPEL